MQRTRPLRVALITNLSPYYRRPLFRLLSERLRMTYYFFSGGEEEYLGSSIRHDPAGLPVREVRRISLAGHPLLVGLQGELSRSRYDVVVKCINGRLMVPYTYALSRRRGLPFVLWTGIWHHPETWPHRATRPLVEGVYRGADAIVTYGTHVKRFLGGVPGVAPEKTFVAGQAIDTTPFSRVSPGFAEPPTILYIGRLESGKGVEVLVNAFDSLSDTEARLRLVGRGSLLRWIQARSRRDRRIEAVGHVEQSRIPAELSAARCLVLPSVTTKRFREPWGLVVNEAMAAGLPVIATTAVGAAAGGLVRDGINGLVLPEGEVPALAASLRRLSSDADLARSLGERARRDVEDFSYERMAQAFHNAVSYACGSA